MAYTQFLKDIGDITNWNIDYLFNYFDLDDLDIFISNDNQSFSKWLIDIINISRSQILYFYYPLFDTIKEFFISFFSFNWIKDFSNLSLPYAKTIRNIVNEDIFIKTQFLEAFDIIQLPVYIDNKFFIGFLNSIFIALPFSCNQIIYFYRFFVSGPTISLIGVLGWLFGQCTLFICILFGFKPIILQWFSLEPLNYFLNIYLIGSFIYETIKVQPTQLTFKNEDDDEYFNQDDKPLKQKYATDYRPDFTLDYKSKEEVEEDTNHRIRPRYGLGRALFRPLYEPQLLITSEKEIERRSKSRYNIDNKSKYPEIKSKYIADLNNRPEFRNLEKIFAMHFLLSWTENNHIFAYLKDLNMGLETNLFEITTVNFFSSYFLVHSSYIFGIITGSLFFSIVYLRLCFQFLTGIISIIIEKDIFKIPKLKRKKSNKEIIRTESIEEKIKRKEKELEENGNGEDDEDNFEKKESRIKIVFGAIVNIYSLIASEIGKLFYEISKIIYEEETEKPQKRDDSKKVPGELTEEEKKKIRETLPKIFRAINFNFLIVLIAITLSSLSYYDTNYLITNSLGFIPQDKQLVEILLTSSSDDPNNESGFGIKKDFLDEYDNDYMQLEINSLDNLEYKNLLESENLNYQAEYAWLSRLDKLGGNETRQSTDKHQRLRKSQYNSRLYEYLEVHPPLQEISDYDNNLNNKKTISKIIDDNYIQSNTNFQFNKNSSDSNFKLDFMPFNKYSLANDIIDVLSLELETEIKQKYYSNPIYKTLLHYDIDTLMSQQPIQFNLLEFEENDIFQKRKALSNYYESNYYYTKLNYFDVFRKTFFNSKSYLNNIYNQQFNGTLRIVERLFPITLNENNRSILKYDFPLLDKSSTNKFQHEELIDKNFESGNNYQGLFNTSASPLFLAWNNELHQLVVTNNLLLKKAITFTDDYSTYSFSNDKFIYGPMTLFNVQKLNNLSRNSYSIIQCPSIKKLFHDSYSLMKGIEPKPVLFDDSDELYLMRLSTLSRPDKNRNNSSVNVNWYAFRYNFTEYRKNLKENQEIYNESKKTRMQEDTNYRSIVEEVERR